MKQAARSTSKEKSWTSKEKTRGTFDYNPEGNNLLIAWRDNKLVIVTTNYLSLNVVSSTKR